MNEDLTPYQFSADLLLQHSIPWVVGITIFCITIHLTLHLFHIWAHAPVFYVIGFLVSLILTLITIIIGLIVLMFSGSFSVFKSIPDLYSVVAYQAYTALILATFFMIYVKNLLKRIYISRTFGVVLLGIAIVTLLYLVSPLSPSYFSQWSENIFTLVKLQFSKH